MTWKRLVVLVAAALCTTCGTLTVHGEDARETGLLATIEGLGVCGPVHRAILDLAPRSADGSFDADSITYETDSPETSTLLMKISAPERFAVADQVPEAVRLFEFSGRVQGLAYYWPILEENEVGEDGLAVVEAAAETLSPSLGEPEAGDTGWRKWSTETLTILARPPSEDSKSTRLLVGCTLTEEAYLAALEAAEQTDAAEDVVETSDKDGLPPNPWLDRDIVSVLLGWGAPLEPSAAPSDEVVCLHYAQFMREVDVPTEAWWWFIDGKAVYVASEFMPPRGSDKPMSSYIAFKNTLRNAFGAPTEERRDEKTGQRYVIYATDTQRLVMTLFDPDGDPWFRLEAFDTNKLDALPADLRPNRSLPERYTPPTPDSGTTREGLGLEIGAG